MAFNFDSGTATDVADWFTKLEAFMILLGWTIEDGSGTQTIVFKSIGEGGARTQLHMRFRQDGVSPEYVWNRAQDDVAGTHATPENTRGGRLDAGGGGAAPFDYWMIGDRDCIIAIFLTGTKYTGTYTGIVERFAVSISDEEKEMVACSIYNTTYNIGTADCGYVLMKYDGTWNCVVHPCFMTSDVQMNPMDNSYPLFGIYVSEKYNDGHAGQLKHLSNRLQTYTGLNAQDTIATGFGGASSWWTIFGTGTTRWAVHTGGALPVGAWEGGFSYSSGVAADLNDLNTKFKAFLATIGWSEVANPSPVYPIDYYLNSSGQLGGDDIWLRWYYNTASSYWGGYAMDDVSDSHHTAYKYIGTDAHPWLLGGDFPVNYFIAGDADCFVHGVEAVSLWGWAWFGMYTSYVPDPTAFATVYKAGCLDKNNRHILRKYDGTWIAAITEWTDRYVNSSPNLIDGTSYLIWPYPLHESVGNHAIGQPKYIHRLHGAALALNDTVTIGGRRYKYLANQFAVRDQ